MSTASGTWNAIRSVFQARVHSATLRGAAAEALAAAERGRALDLAGRRADAEAAYLRQADHAAAAGLTGSQLRALVPLGELELPAGRPPDRMIRARTHDRFEAAGATVHAA